MLYFDKLLMFLKLTFRYIGALIKDKCKSSEEDEEINRFIIKLQLNDIIDKHSFKIKMFFTLLVLILLYIVYSHLTLIENDEVAYQTLKGVVGWTILAIISLFIIIFWPAYYIMIARMFMWFVLICLANMSTAFHEFAIHEYWLPWLSFWYLMVIIAPNYWKSNCLIFISCFIYFVIWVYLKYGEITVRFKLTTYATIFYFIMASLLLNSKMNQLWSAILKSEKLAVEMKKILTIFPNGVLIHSGLTDNVQKQVIFSNQQFMNQIVGIDKKIKEFESIEVNVQKHSVDSVLVSMSLKSLLLQHQRKVIKEEIIHQDKVVIKWRINEGDTNELLEEDKLANEESIERIFNIKTMKVEWEDKPCFMHVFVDTTNIVKLEEANNNIRCQKIMFTSASHEFRTPLNAITNSYNLISSNFCEISNEITRNWDNWK